ncbi:MAG: 50S ribosomal protein L11 methyltransferase [Desulfobacterales bacterium]|nr:50S ribosomal protein L11 methyltransferase [Desulfobacterales bacterium]
MNDGLDRIIADNTGVLLDPAGSRDPGSPASPDDSPLWRYRSGTPGLKRSDPGHTGPSRGAAARPLARYVLDHLSPSGARSVLDFGAGCGIASIAAAKAGARMVAGLGHRPPRS